MQAFHRFVSSKKGKSSTLNNFDSRVDQQNKQYGHNQDEEYIMHDESQQSQMNNQNQEQLQKTLQDEQVDPLDAFMTGLGHDLKQQPIGFKIQNNRRDQGQIQHHQFQDQQQLSQFQQDSQKRQINHHNHHQQQQDQSHHHHNQFQDEFQQKNHHVGQQTYQNKTQKHIIENLKPFDFSNVELQDFQKDFYDQHSDITRLTQLEVKNYRKQHQIKVSGQDVPKPIISFGHLQLDQKMKRIILKEEFQKPTPIQAQALPAALQGRDIIGVAKTGSGKTLAYVWPLITHVGHQRQGVKGQGPIALVLAPTRELCQQIYVETKRYAKKYDIKIACLLGGQNKHQQWKILKAGIDILIASPGRLIQMIKKKATNMFRVTYLVLDEADKMLSLGFQQQIRSIVSQTRPDRQTLLFTATMKKSMQFLAFDILMLPIRINVGQQNSANEDVKQQVMIVNQKQQKLEWIKSNLNQLLTEGKVLIFCNQKQTCEEIKIFIESNLFITALTLHGDKSQYERTTIMNSFKTNETILIATDIAGRGIDVKNIKTVVNFQCPKTIEAYIHRIGRAGRAGQTGTAISFLNKSQSSIKFSIQLIKIFENSGYPVSKQLQDLACLDDFYRRKRISSKMGVSFAKGKDASKYLNQILKKQQMGNSRAGLGMNPALSGYNVNQKGKSSLSAFNRDIQVDQQEIQNKDQKSIAEIMRQKGILSQNLSISELSKIIREQKQIKDKKNLASSRLKSHFMRSSQGRIGSYEPQLDNQKKQFEKSSLQENQQNKQKKDSGVTITFYKKK